MVNSLDTLGQSLPQMSVDALKKKATSPKDDPALKEACAGFESIFLKKIMENMRGTLQGDALFGTSHAMGIFESMYDQELAEQLSRSEPSAGLKEFLYREFKAAEFSRNG